MISQKTFRMKKKYTFMALNDIYTTPSVDSVKKTSEYKKGNVWWL